jgi:ribosomal-protein-alanine N-acetyltransferase
MPIPESFQTARLTGERLSSSHLSDLLNLHRNSQAMAQLGGVRDEAERLRYLTRNLEHWATHRFGIWMLRSSEDGHPIGRVVLRWLSTASVDDVEIGIALLPNYWGRGIATEAAEFCLQLAEFELGLKTLIGITTPENRASQRLLCKLGLDYESETVVGGTRCFLYRICW